MSKLQALPTVLLLKCGEYLNDEEQIESFSCCKEWYNQLLKGHFRKFRIRVEKYREDTRILVFITNPAHQLHLFLHKNRFMPDGTAILRECNFRLYRLQCSEPQLVLLVQSADSSLQLTELELNFERRRGCSLTGSLDLEVVDSLSSKVTGLKSLSLYAKDIFDFELTSLPFIPSLRRLSLTFIIIKDAQNIFSSYSKTLHRLAVDQCTISDVSMLGSIPSLSLNYCDGLVDISALNNNQDIEIISCESLRDFSRSFAHSKRIQIRVAGGEESYIFDLTRWKSGEELVLEDHESYCSIIKLQQDNRLPKTVKKCRLHGNFVSLVDFTVTADHRLRKLTLEWNPLLISLEDYRLENVAIIEITGLENLETLNGLGWGKNRKIVVKHCHSIRDFSSISQTPIVEITNCWGYTEEVTRIHK